ncbi:Rab11 family-interacting protein 3, partial [Exaiptasia diaphana]
MDAIAANLKPIFDSCDKNGDGFVKTQDLIQYSGLGGQENSKEDIKTLLHKLDPDGVGQITFEDFCRRFHDSLGVSGELQKEPHKRSSQDSDNLEDSCFEGDSTYSTTSTNEYNADDDETFQEDDPLNSSFRRNLKQYSTYPPPTEPRTKHRTPLPRLYLDNSHSDTSEYQSEEGYEGFGERLVSEETLQETQSVKEPILPQDRFHLHKSYSSNSLPFRRRISANSAALLSSPRLFQSLSANTSRRNSMDDLCGASDCSGPLSDPEAGMQSTFLFSEIQRLSSQVSLLVEDQKLQTSKQYRIKEDNSELSMRINALEDQLHHHHEKTGEKVLQESRKYKSALNKLEKDNEETLSVLTHKLRQAEEEIVKLKSVEPMLRKELDVCYQEKQELLKHIEQLEKELQNEKDLTDSLRKKLETQAEAALEERQRHEEEENSLSQQVLELSNFKSEAEVKLKDTVDLEQKSIELEERVHQLTRVGIY